MTVRVFLSYNSKDRKAAGRLKESLSLLGMDVFLAHEDLEPSSDWQKRILEELKRCDVFMPLLTPKFRSSVWTDQETGIAFARKKVIVPLKASLDPHGFIGKLQAQKVRDQIEETCWKIAHVLASRPRLARAVREGVIAPFLESGSFDESKSRVRHLSTFEPFSSVELNRIVEGAAKNTQIYGGWAARDFVRKLIRENRPKIKRASVRKFEERVKSWG